MFPITVGYRARIDIEQLGMIRHDSVIGFT